MNGLLAVLRMLLTLFAKNAESSPVASEKKETIRSEIEKETAHSEILFKNESKRLEAEYGELYEKNRHLYDVLIETALYCYHTFGKTITITMIYRTQEEQDSIYKDDPKYQVKKFKSPHQFHHAFDLRSSTFEASEIEKLVNYLNSTYNGTNYYNWTAKCHNIGLGDHFHVQFCKK